MSETVVKPYIVSARKYRPDTFRSVVGQKALTTTLKNAIDTGRLAQAYLFCGPRGVGKTSCARIFAKTINCLHPTPEGEACNECESCRSFNEGRSINVVELDAASNNSVDNIRALTDQVQVPPQIGKYRVFIIDEVHMLSTSAFNAFLKTLEEPPSYVIFILATTEKHKVIPTILSRCQIYDFSRIMEHDIAEHLGYVAQQEGISAEPSALNLIARKADGAMRDALSIFDQVSASSQGNITYNSALANLGLIEYDTYFSLVDAFLKGDVPEALLLYKKVRDTGFDSLNMVSGLGAHLRNLLVAADPRTIPLLEVGDDLAPRYKEQAARIKPQWAYQAMEIINACEVEYRVTSSRQFLVELSLIRLCQIVNPKSAAKPAGISSLPPLRQPAPASQQAPQSPAAPAAAPTPPSAPQAPQQPQAAASPAPEQVRSTAAAPTPSARPAVNRPGTIRISHRTRQEAPEQSPAQNSAATAAPAPSDSPPTIEKLAEAWKGYGLIHPEKHLLLTAIRTSEPTPTPDPFTFAVKVDNPSQQQEVENNMQSLMEHLRSATGCQSLKIAIEVAPRSERPKVLTNREFLNKLIQDSPIIAEMLTDLEAEFIM